MFSSVIRKLDLKIMLNWERNLIHQAPIQKLPLKACNLRFILLFCPRKSLNPLKKLDFGNNEVIYLLNIIILFDDILEKTVCTFKTDG